MLTFDLIGLSSLNLSTFKKLNKKTDAS